MRRYVGVNTSGNRPDSWGPTKWGGMACLIRIAYDRMKQMKMKPFFGACWKFASLMVAAQNAVRHSLCCGILVLILTAGTARAQATPGVTEKEVTIGSCS